MIIAPITSVDRGWPHHVPVRSRRLGLAQRGFAMTEQPRTIGIERIERHSGLADDATMADVDQWLADFFGLN